MKKNILSIFILVTILPFFIYGELAQEQIAFLKSLNTKGYLGNDDKDCIKAWFKKTKTASKRQTLKNDISKYKINKKIHSEVMAYINSLSIFNNNKAFKQKSQINNNFLPDNFSLSKAILNNDNAKIITFINRKLPIKVEDLYLAFKFAEKDMIDLILKNISIDSFSKNAKPINNNTVLMMAASDCDLCVLKKILDYGAKIDLFTEIPANNKFLKRTALDFAAKSAFSEDTLFEKQSICYETFLTLIERGAKPTLNSAKLATRYRHDKIELFTLLYKKGLKRNKLFSHTLLNFILDKDKELARFIILQSESNDLTHILHNRIKNTLGNDYAQKNSMINLFIKNEADINAAPGALSILSLSKKKYKITDFINIAANLMEKGAVVGFDNLLNSLKNGSDKQNFLKSIFNKNILKYADKLKTFNEYENKISLLNIHNKYLTYFEIVEEKFIFNQFKSKNLQELFKYFSDMNIPFAKEIELLKSKQKFNLSKEILLLILAEVISAKAEEELSVEENLDFNKNFKPLIQKLNKLNNYEIIFRLIKLNENVDNFVSRKYVHKLFQAHNIKNLFDIIDEMQLKSVPISLNNYQIIVEKILLFNINNILLNNKYFFADFKEQINKLKNNKTHNNNIKNGLTENFKDSFIINLKKLKKSNLKATQILIKITQLSDLFYEFNKITNINIKECIYMILNLSLELLNINEYEKIKNDIFDVFINDLNYKNVLQQITKEVLNGLSLKIDSNQFLEEVNILRSFNLLNNDSCEWKKTIFTLTKNNSLQKLRDLLCLRPAESFFISKGDCLVCYEEKNLFKCPSSNIDCESRMCADCANKFLFSCINDIKLGKLLSCKFCQKSLFLVDFFIESGCDANLVAELEENQLRTMIINQFSEWIFCVNPKCLEGKIYKNEEIRLFNCDACFFYGCLECGKNHEGCFNNENELIRLTLEKGRKAPDPYISDITDANFDNGKIRPCPECGILTYRISGCNSMECSKCKIKWHWNYGLNKQPIIHDFNNEEMQYEAKVAATFR